MAKYVKILLTFTIPHDRIVKSNKIQNTIKYTIYQMHTQTFLYCFFIRKGDYMKTLLKKMTLIGVAVLSGVALTACSGGSARKEAHGVINAASLDQINVLDPVRAEFAQDKELIENTQALLAELDKDGKTKLVAAEKWEASSDQKTFTITLKSGLKWSDGTDLTAKDYTFYYDAIKADAESTYKYFFDTLVSYEAKDDKTLVLSFNAPRPLFEMTDLTVGFPLNKAFYEKVGGAGHYGTSQETVLFSGPFVLADWTGKDATSWKLTKNDKYFDATNVLVEGVNTRYIDNPQTIQQEFDAGNVDYVELRGRAMHDQYKDKKKVLEKQATYYFLKQGKNADLENKNLRRAIDAAINREDVIQAAPGYETFEGGISRNSLFDKSGKDIRDYESAKTEKRYSDTKAKEYWEKAKQELGKSSVSLSYLVFNNAQNIAVAQVIKDQVEKTLPGLTLNIDPKDSNTYTELSNNGKYELLFQGWSSFGDPEGSFYPFTKNSWNKSGVTHQEVLTETDKLNKLISEQPGDLPAIFEQSIKAEKALLETGQMIPLYQKVQTIALTDRVETYSQNIMATKQYKNFVIK